MEIELSPDGMHAYVMPGYDGQGMTVDALVETIHRQLKSSGVARGLNEDVIRSVAERMAGGEILSEQVEVATGQRQQDGTDGRVGFRFTVDGRPPVLVAPTGKPASAPPAHHKDFVRSGDLLATVAAACPGVDGFTVAGGALKAKPCTDVQLKAGVGVRRLDDGSTYVVAPDVSGYANCINGTLTVENPVTVSGDAMEATLLIYPVPEGGAAPAWADAERWLFQQGVTHGICAEAVVAGLELARIPGTSAQLVVAAQGAHAMPGTNASIEICFPSKPLVGGPQGPEGRIDYHERDFLHRVRQGELLARKIPATRGVAGADVRGKPIPTTDGRDLKLEAAGDTLLSDDGLECRAAQDGIAVVVNGTKVGVFKEYTVPGDVDLKTGNLHMNGALTIQGWVRAGFKVSATGSVVVGGGIESSDVQVEANLNVHGGISGARHGFVRCAGSVSAQYIENASVETGGDVRVRDDILNSHVAADGVLTATEGKGRIVGGRVRAARGMQVNEIGSRAAVRTIVDVGFDTETRQHLATMARDCALYERNQQKITRTLADLAHRGKGRALGYTENQAHMKLIQYRRDIETKKRAIAEYWKRLDDVSARVKVARVVHDGTTVFVYGRRLDVTSDIALPGEFALDVKTGGVAYLPPATNKEQST